MAVDSRDKRGSVLGLALGLALVLPNPDGLTLDQGDRQQVALSYRGVSAQAAEAADGEIVYVAAHDRTVAVEAQTRTVAVQATDRTILCETRPTP